MSPFFPGHRDSEHKPKIAQKKNKKNTETRNLGDQLVRTIHQSLKTCLKKIFENNDKGETKIFQEI